MSPAPGTLWLVPNALDFGTEGQDLCDALPLGTVRLAARLGHWVAEDARSARAFLKRVHALVPLQQALQAVNIQELPRPPKGRAPAATPQALAPLLAPALEGHDLGLISEAGLPAVADPGSLLVAQAHRAGVPVRCAPGASALSLALACSGLDGQRFAFHGYLPVAADERAQRIRELEAASRRGSQTQLVIETPYRNAALWQALVATLQPTTRLCLAQAVGLAGSQVLMRTVREWRAAPLTPDDRVPAVFLWQA